MPWILRLLHFISRFSCLMAFSNEHSIAFAHDEAKTLNGTLLPWKLYAASIAHKNINIKCKFLSYKMNISKEFFLFSSFCFCWKTSQSRIQPGTNHRNATRRGKLQPFFGKINRYENRVNVISHKKMEFI